MRYRLDVVAASVVDVVMFAGGWLFDRALAGWEVTVLLTDHPDDRPLRILGAQTLDLEYALASAVHWPRPQTLAAAADLFGCDSRVRQGVLQALDQGVTEVPWLLADRVLDDFLVGGEGEFIKGFAAPFTLFVIADLLGVPDADRNDFVQNLHRNVGGGLGSTEGESLAHSPLEFIYGRFATYIEDRRREPRDDVLTGLATATCPDGSLPEVADVVRVATNVFSAGQETTVRLLGSALRIMAENPDFQKLVRKDHSRILNFIEETLRIESPVKGDFRLSCVPTEVGGVEMPAGTTVMVLQAAANRDPRRFEEPGTFDPARKNARQHLAFGRGIHTCPGAPLARAETRVAIERLLDRTADIRICERVHGPANNRRYHYVPTYILRGLTELHLEFDPA